jgi:tetratricopeptide (TPR) repeat protein
MAIKELAIDVAFDSYNPEKNFALANAYFDTGQFASAAGFYLRAAERGYKTHSLIAYTSLLRMSLCFSKHGDRNATVYQNTLQALTLLPGRPEAYFLLARIHERNKEWQKAYTFAELGLANTLTSYNNPLPVHVEYNGSYVLLFEKAVAGWWLGYKEESKKLFDYLLDDVEMSQEYVNSCINNLRLF